MSILKRLTGRGEEPRESAGQEKKTTFRKGDMVRICSGTNVSEGWVIQGFATNRTGKVDRNSFELINTMTGESISRTAEQLSNMNSPEVNTALDTDHANKLFQERIGVGSRIRLWFQGEIGDDWQIDGTDPQTGNPLVVRLGSDGRPIKGYRYLMVTWKDVFSYNAVEKKVLTVGVMVRIQRSPKSGGGIEGGWRIEELLVDGLGVKVVNNAGDSKEITWKRLKELNPDMETYNENQARKRIARAYPQTKRQ